MSTARHHTPEKIPLGSDLDLYEKVFQGFGVSQAQFSDLMSLGTRYKAAPGGLVVKGGTTFKKVAMIITGEAVAHKFKPELKDDELGKPMCKYVGKLHALSRGAVKDAPGELPTRGSVIGGSGLADSQVTSGRYPADVIASTHLEWVEWDLENLQVIIDRPRWRSVQATFYYMLYVDLLGTLDRDRAAKLQKKEVKREGEVQSPSLKQLLQLSAFVAVPFCGFGFADNFIMIIAGDAIDENFGAALGLTTLAAAGLGNWLSDVIGLGLGDVIERGAQRVGLSDGRLSPAQSNMNVAKLTTLASKILGITAGCFLGMVPLLFLSPSKKEFAKEDLSLYDEVFCPYGVSTDAFATLMEKGTKHWATTGATVLTGGVPCKKVMLLLRGEVAAYPHQPGGAKSLAPPVWLYVGRLGNEGATLAHPKLTVRGSVIGGAALAEQVKQGSNYPNDLIACKNVEWIEWDFEELSAVLHEEKAIEASFFSMLYCQLVRTVSKVSSAQRIEQYQTLLSAVIMDGVVDEKERDFVRSHQEKFRISDEDHYLMLSELGWSADDWKRGALAGSRTQQASLAVRRPGNATESVLQLQRAQALIEGVMLSLEQ